MGYFRILAGHNSLGIEMEVAWANPGAFTIHNFACYEDGSNCVDTFHYQDPSKDLEKVHARLEADKAKIKARTVTSSKGKTGIRG
jgi:cathepsin X